MYVRTVESRGEERYIFIPEKVIAKTTGQEGGAWGGQIPCDSFARGGRCRSNTRAVALQAAELGETGCGDIPIPMVTKGARMEVNMGTWKDQHKKKGVDKDARGNRKASRRPGGPVDSRGPGRRGVCIKGRENLRLESDILLARWRFS